MNKLSLQDLIFQALIGASYVVLVLLLIPISYGDVQFRIAEALLILIFFSRKNAIGLLIGTFVANLFSPDGLELIDAVFGTLTTALVLFLMSLLKNKPVIALLFPVLLNAIYVALLLKLTYDLPLWLTMFSVGSGEAAVVYIIGLPLYYLLRKNQSFVELFN